MKYVSAEKRFDKLYSAYLGLEKRLVELLLAIETDKEVARGNFIVTVDGRIALSDKGKEKLKKEKEAENDDGTKQRSAAGIGGQ